MHPTLAHFLAPKAYRVNGGRCLFTLEEAEARRSTIFEGTGIVVSVEKVTPTQSLTVNGKSLDHILSIRK